MEHFPFFEKSSKPSTVDLPGLWLITPDYLSATFVRYKGVERQAFLHSNVIYDLMQNNWIGETIFL